MATAMTKTFKVSGFHCSGCSKNLGAALSNLEGVIRARAEFKSGNVEVRFDPDRVSEDDLRREIHALGFEPD